jgi:ABC-type Fe3+ transport system permease subunit
MQNPIKSGLPILLMDLILSQCNLSHISKSISLRYNSMIFSNALLGVPRGFSDKTVDTLLVSTWYLFYVTDQTDIQMMMMIMVIFNSVHLCANLTARRPNYKASTRRKKKYTYKQICRTMLIITMIIVIIIIIIPLIL